MGGGVTIEWYSPLATNFVIGTPSLSGLPEFTYCIAGYSYDDDNNSLAKGAHRSSSAKLCTVITERGSTPCEALLS